MGYMTLLSGTGGHRGLETWLLTGGYCILVFAVGKLSVCMVFQEAQSYQHRYFRRHHPHRHRHHLPRADGILVA